MHRFLRRVGNGSRPRVVAVATSARPRRGQPRARSSSRSAAGRASRCASCRGARKRASARSPRSSALPHPRGRRGRSRRRQPPALARVAAAGRSPSRASRSARVRLTRRFFRHDPPTGASCARSAARSARRCSGRLPPASRDAELLSGSGAPCGPSRACTWPPRRAGAAHRHGLRLRQSDVTAIRERLETLPLRAPAPLARAQGGAGGHHARWHDGRRGADACSAATGPSPSARSGSATAFSSARRSMGAAPMTDATRDQPRAVLARVQPPRARGGPGPERPAPRAREVPRHLQLEPRRVLHGPRGRAQAPDPRRRPRARRPTGSPRPRPSRPSPRRIHELVDEQHRCFLEEIQPLLAAEGIAIVRPKEVTRRAARLPRGLLPADAPARASRRSPSTPGIPSRISATARSAWSPRCGPPRPSPLPARHPRPRPHPRATSCRASSPCPRPPGQHAFMLLEDVIRMHLPWLYHGYEIVSCHAIRVTRDADLQLGAGERRRTCSPASRRACGSAAWATRCACSTTPICPTQS